MAGIDEREEFDLTTDSDGRSMHPNSKTRPSNVAKKYNFQDFYTPGQNRKKRLQPNDTLFN